MYKYYKETENEEHMLYASEIAKLYNIYTKTDKPASAFITKLIEVNEEFNDKYTQLYYHSGKGLQKVYPYDTYNKIKDNISITDKNVYVTSRLKNKQYTIIIKEQ